MANLLLLDDNETAARALRGIVARGNHRLLWAHDPHEAWDQIRAAVKLDLLIMELKIKDQNVTLFLQQLRNDALLKHLPVVVYTKLNDHNEAKRVLALKVQNYLFKPYHDETVLAEIAKALANPWRDLLFEEPKSFCAQMGIATDDLLRMRQNLVTAVDQCMAVFPDFAETKPLKEVFTRIAELTESAEAAGVWALVDYLKLLHGKASQDDWGDFKRCKEDFEVVRRLILCQINPAYIPDGLLTESEQQAQRESAERAIWTDYNVDTQGPMMQSAQVMAALDRLPSVPVIDTVAAGFQMTVGGQTVVWNHVLDLICKDPSLTACVLVAANRLDRPDPTPIEDPRAAMGLLGDLKLASLARTLSVVEERHMRCPPITWTHFWMFQIGVARLAHYACQSLEFHDLTSQAFAAGLLHDLGKLLLLKLYPFGFQAMVNYAGKNSESLHAVERKYIGCDTREMGYYFARKNGLPNAYCHVIRWVDLPDQAPDDAELVAVVSMARQFCLQNHIGYCGDTPRDACRPIMETPAWSVLQKRIYPGFNLKRFEQQVHDYCTELRKELLGKFSQAPA